MKLLATAEMRESDEYKDIVLRISTNRGSCTLVIVNESTVSTAEQIGKQILDCFNYLIQSDLIPQKEL